MSGMFFEVDCGLKYKRASEAHGNIRSVTMVNSSIKLL